MFYFKNLETNQVIEFENQNSIGDVFCDADKYKKLNENEIAIYQLQKAKDEKLLQLRINFNNASQKPFGLSQVKQIDKDGKVIGTIDTTFNINDTNLTASENIIFAGSFMIIQAWFKVLCQSIKVDFTAIENAVNALSDNPATSSIANIPYTTKDKNGNEIRVLLSFRVIQEIFKHIFNRVADYSKAFNIIEEQIKKASTIEELEKIDINI
jgi:hypothetical protein